MIENFPPDGEKIIYFLVHHPERFPLRATPALDGFKLAAVNEFVGLMTTADTNDVTRPPVAGNDLFDLKLRPAGVLLSELLLLASAGGVNASANELPALAVAAPELPDEPDPEDEPEDEPEDPVDEDVPLVDALEEDEKLAGVVAVTAVKEAELSEPVIDVVAVVVEPNDDELSDPVIDVVDGL